MSYDALLEKVRQAEQALEARERSVSADWRQTRRSWRALWTPGRIAAAGVIAGFAFGWSRAGRASVAGTGFGLLKLGTSLVTLVGSLQAKAAADEAGDAATKTRVAAHDARKATEAGDRGPPEPATDTAHSERRDRRRPDPSWSSRPTAAEAATDVSERPGRR
jgi:hypothetical protein